MKKNILTAILFAAFAQACSTNPGNVANTTNTTPAAANTNQTNSSAATPANVAKPAVENKAKADTSKKNSGIDTKTDEQIQFAKGETETTLERTIAPDGSKMFLFKARKGQMLRFKATESSNQLQVDFNKASVRLGEEVRQELNASGDWAIYISNPANKPLTYKLWIGVE